MKKIMVMLLMLSFLLIPYNIYAQPLDHTFSVYSQLISTELYPKIQSFLSDLDIKTPLGDKQANILSEKVFDLIIEIFKEKEFTTIIPPVVAVYKLENDTYIIYTLEIMLSFFDSETSIKGKFASSMLFGKKFVIVVYDKKRTEV